MPLLWGLIWLLHTKYQNTSETNYMSLSCSALSRCQEKATLFVKLAGSYGAQEGAQNFVHNRRGAANTAGL